MGKVVRPHHKQPQHSTLPHLFRPLQVLYNPSGLFTAMKQDWSWGWAYLFAGSGILIGNLLTLSTATNLVLTKLEEAGLPKGLLDFNKKFILASNLVLPWVTPMVQAFLIASLIHFLCLFMDVRVRFSKLFSLVLHAFLPTYMVGQVIKGFMAMFMPPDMILRINLSPAILVPEGIGGTWGHVFLSTLDIFLVTSMFLLAFGFTIIHRQPTRKGALCAAVLYGVVCLQTLAMAPVAR